MKLLVLAARVPKRYWSDSDFLADLLLALAARGHEIELVADCVEDPAMFEPSVRGAGVPIKIRALNPYENTAPHAPRALAKILRRRLDHGGYDVALSTTGLATSGVWMPVEPNAMSWLNHASQALPPHSLALTLLRHHYAFGSAITERAALRRARPGGGPGGGPGAVRHVVAMGARAAAALRSSLPGLSSCVVDVGYASRISLGADAATLRESTRAALGLDPERPVVLIAQLAAGRWIRPLLTALGEFHREAPERCPGVIVAARDAFAIHALAARRGAVAPMRLVGTTARLDAVLAASDVLAVPMTRGRSMLGAEGSGWCSRMVAGALAAGRPVLAAADAPGAELVESTGAGVLVDPPNAGAWRDALERTTDPRWRAAASPLASGVGAGLGFDNFVGRFEGVLRDAAS